MTFNSVKFLCFFPLVCLCYFLLPKRIRWVWLLAASYFFYMCWNVRYSLLMLTSTVITYWSGLQIARARSSGGKRFYLIASLASNLAILIFFKYSSFLIDNLNAISRWLGNDVAFHKFDVLLPVGISFYTFQALSYTMDVYRNQIQAESNFFRYALYVSFFPQLVAGPIERSKNLLPQVREAHSFDWARMRSGLYLMLWGYFEKMVIADRIAIAVDCIYGNYTEYSGLLIAGATLLFALQIYCDFGGYSHIAIGAAEILGFRLMNNFQQPYFSTSVQEFWRRWHISLSTWFKDYVYIPLGGNRKGRLRQNLNLMLTFLISGLWHGADWRFILWGGVNGAFQIVGSYKNRLLARSSRIARFKETRTACLMRIICTYLLISFAWLFFRASNVSQAFDMLRWSFNSFARVPLIRKFGLSLSECALLGASIALLFTVDVVHERGISIREGLARSYPLRSLGVALFIAGFFAILLFGVYGLGYNAAAFIYFQF